MRLALEDDELVISLSLAERIMATKCKDVRVPLAAVTNVDCEQTAWSPIGINMGRVHIPGRVHFGTVLTHQGKQFWATRRKQEHLVLHLKDGAFVRQVILGFDRDEHTVWAERIKGYLAGTESSAS